MPKFSIGDTVLFQGEQYLVNVDEIDNDGIYGIVNEESEEFALETELIIIEHGTDRD